MGKLKIKIVGDAQNQTYIGDLMTGQIFKYSGFWFRASDEFDADGKRLCSRMSDNLILHISPDEIVDGDVYELSLDETVIALKKVG